MSYKAVIFDLDGTLLNTIGDIANPVNIVLARYGYPVHSLDDYRYFIGDGIGQLVYRALPPDVAESNKYPTILADVWTEYQLNLNKSTVPYNGITELLDGLTAKGIALNILSNKSHEFMDEVVQRFFAKWDFELVFGARKGLPLKPSPHSIFEMMDLLQLEPENFVYVGDSDVDMLTANSAGVFAVGAAWGFRGKEELLAHGADLVIDYPEQLLGLFN